MNAYELADAIEDWKLGANYTIAIKVGQMLRQQADQIAELETKYEQALEYAELLKEQVK